MIIKKECIKDKPLIAWLTDGTGRTSRLSDASTRQKTVELAKTIKKEYSKLQMG